MMALDEIKILEVALQYPGPYCTMLLGDMGANILKVERPITGDPARVWPAFFNSINRNKRSITLDLKRSEGKEILTKLVKRYDVLTEGFRPGAANRLGIDYETVSKINPKLIYCSISGYGQNGPYRDLPGHDINYLAISGMLGCFAGEDNVPIRPMISIADLSSGMFAALGILASIVARKRTGKGQYIDCSMLDSLLSWMSVDFGNFFETGKRLVTHDPGYDVFRTADDKYITIGIAHEDYFWDRLCRVIGLEDLKNITADERTRRQSELAEKLKEIFVTRKRDEWVEIITKADVPVAPVNELDEVIKDPQVAAREMIQEMINPDGKKTYQMGFPMKFSATHALSSIPPPSLGEHTDSILEELGYNGRDIGTFKKDGIV